MASLYKDKRRGENVKAIRGNYVDWTTLLTTRYPSVRSLYATLLTSIRVFRGLADSTWRPSVRGNVVLIRSSLMYTTGVPSRSGKSAIAHNIAHRCNLEKLLLANFFFSCSDPAHSNAKSFIMTIAYQILVNVSGTRERIVGNIEQDPLILT